MDIEWLSVAMTVVLFAVFIGIVAWAWSGGAARGFEEAALLPFDEDDEARRGHEARR